MRPGKKNSGRPPKFQEARRPITVTLPERTLQQLAAIHVDRARAIVKATSLALAIEKGEKPLVEIVEVAPGQAVLVVGPSRALKIIPWLKLVEIAPSRYLLAIPTGTAVESLEIAILDQIENLAPHDTYERDLLSALSRELSHVRRRERVSKAEILFVDTREVRAKSGGKR